MEKKSKKVSRNLLGRLMSLALCVLLCFAALPLSAQAAKTGGENPAASDPYAVQEMFFCNKDAELWLVGRLNQPTQPLAVAVFITLPTELRQPSEDTYLYPVDENGYFALPAAVVADDAGILISKYDVYVTDGANPPANDYSEIKQAALSKAIFDLTGSEYSTILVQALPLPEVVQARLQAETPLVANTPEPGSEATAEPTKEATEEPTEEPVEEPTAEPVVEQTEVPAEDPTAEPTEEPTAEPTEEPTAEPTEEPTAEPTEEPTAEPTEEPTAEPTEEPTAEPTEEPTPVPTEEPTATPEPTPEPMTEAMAENAALQLLETELNPESAVAYRTGVNDLLLHKMLEGVAVEPLQEGGYQALIYAPHIEKAPTLPAYRGETPSNYITKWQNELRTAAESLEMTGGLTLVIPIPANGEWSDVERLEFRNWFWGTAGTEIWLRQAIERSGVYGALSRLLLPIDRNQNWFSERFVSKDQAPQYAVEDKDYGRMVRGSKGDSVKAAQQALIALGYLEEGSDDGIFGKNMEQAVKDFQTANSLKADGVLASKTQAILFVSPEGVTIKDVMLENGVSQAELDSWWPLFLRSMYEINWNAEDPGMPVLYYLTVDYDAMAAEVAAELEKDAGSLDSKNLEEALIAKVTEAVGSMEHAQRKEMRLSLLAQNDADAKTIISAIGSNWIEGNFKEFLAAVQTARELVQAKIGK